MLSGSGQQRPGDVAGAGAAPVFGTIREALQEDSHATGPAERDPGAARQGSGSACLCEPGDVEAGAEHPGSNPAPASHIRRYTNAPAHGDSTTSPCSYGGGGGLAKRPRTGDGPGTTSRTVPADLTAISPPGMHPTEPEPQPPAYHPQAQCPVGTTAEGGTAGVASQRGGPPGGPSLLLPPPPPEHCATACHAAGGDGQHAAAAPTCSQPACDDEALAGRAPVSVVQPTAAGGGGGSGGGSYGPLLLLLQPPPPPPGAVRVLYQTPDGRLLSGGTAAAAGVGGARGGGGSGGAHSSPCAVAEHGGAARHCGELESARPGSSAACDSGSGNGSGSGKGPSGPAAAPARAQRVESGSGCARADAGALPHRAPPSEQRPSQCLECASAPSAAAATTVPQPQPLACTLVGGITGQHGGATDNATHATDESPTEAEMATAGAAAWQGSPGAPERQCTQGTRSEGGGVGDRAEAEAAEESLDMGHTWCTSSRSQRQLTLANSIPTSAVPIAAADTSTALKPTGTCGCPAAARCPAQQRHQQQLPSLRLIFLDAPYAGGGADESADRDPP